MLELLTWTFTSFNVAKFQSTCLSATEMIGFRDSWTSCWKHTFVKNSVATLAIFRIILRNIKETSPFGSFQVTFYLMDCAVWENNIASIGHPVYAYNWKEVFSTNKVLAVVPGTSQNDKGGPLPMGCSLVKNITKLVLLWLKIILVCNNCNRYATHVLLQCVNFFVSWANFTYILHSGSK